MALRDMFKKKSKTEDTSKKTAPESEKAAPAKENKASAASQKAPEKKAPAAEQKKQPKAETAKTAEKPTAKKAAPEAKITEKTTAKAAPKETAKATQPAKPKVAKNAEPVEAKKAPKSEPKVAVVDEEKTDAATDSKGYTGRFEINKSKDGKKFFFNLYASNKVGIATSQMYSTAQSALNGIKSVIANADKAPIEDQSLKKYETLPFPKWEIYMDNGGKYRFRLNASNGNCVCHSQGYTTKTACKNGIESIIRSSRNPEIDKTYITTK